jgi:hypothetical protein
MAAIESGKSKKEYEKTRPTCPNCCMLRTCGEITLLHHKPSLCYPSLLLPSTKLVLYIGCLSANSSGRGSNILAPPKSTFVWFHSAFRLLNLEHHWRANQHALLTPNKTGYGRQDILCIWSHTWQAIFKSYHGHVVRNPCQIECQCQGAQSAMGFIHLYPLSPWFFPWWLGNTGNIMDENGKFGIFWHHLLHFWPKQNHQPQRVWRRRTSRSSSMLSFSGRLERGRRASGSGIPWGYPLIIPGMASVYRKWIPGYHRKI